ncbi:MAG: insulinase family protein, partial [bacterium]
TDSSLREFFYEIDRTFKDGITEDDLEFVKKGLTGSFALTFETPAQIAGALQNVVLYNLPEDYYEMYLQNINKVTLQDVQKVAKKYLDTSKMAVVVVGDLKVIRDPVEKMKFGQTVLTDVGGNKIQ